MLGIDVTQVCRKEKKNVSLFFRVGELRTAQQQTSSSVRDHSRNDEIFEEMETVQG